LEESQALVKGRKLFCNRHACRIEPTHKLILAGYRLQEIRSGVEEDGLERTYSSTYLR
jgi:hypothetical protein